MRPVEALRLKSIGKPCKYNCRLRFLCRLYCLRKQLLIRLVFLIVKSLGIGNIGHALYLVQCRSDLMAVDVGTAAALITGRFCIFSDKGNLIFVR